MTENKPTTDFSLIQEWFGIARDKARQQGKEDSAELWGDGLCHLNHLNSVNDVLVESNNELLGALECVVDSFTPEEWEGLDSHTQEKVLGAIKSAKGE